MTSFVRLKQEVWDRIWDPVHRLGQSASPINHRNQAKRAVLALWSVLTPEDRRQFLERIDQEGDLSFIEFRPQFPGLDDPVLEAAARAWGLITPNLEGADAEFGADVAKRMRWRNWKPSPKQADWMKRLYRNWKKWRDVDARSAEVAAE